MFFSIPYVPDKVSSLLNTVICLLISNIPSATVIHWTDEQTKQTNVSFPYSTEVERLLSEMIYLCRGYKDIDYERTIISSFSNLTKYVFNVLYQQAATKTSLKQFEATPTIYAEISKITGIDSQSSTIKGIIMIMHLSFFVLQSKQGKFVEYINFLRDQKSVNITRISKNVSSAKGKQHILLHEWNVVCINEEMDDLLGNNWSFELKDHRKLLDDFRKGKKSEIDLDKVDANIERLAGPGKSIIYSRQKRLHAFMKKRREEQLLLKKSTAEKLPPITPNRDAWRDYCIKQEDKLSLSTITVPLIQMNLIKSERELHSFIATGRIERSLSCVLWAQRDITSEPWYSSLLQYTEEDYKDPDMRIKALNLLTRIESVTLKTVI